ncbi:flagellar basal body P-ring protein FlgI [Parvularcula sp. LCG005]|uniref:flagellar basal body P-ring protein FlgI n=1 Tax=Parvularcula sp. LCG005 TaxID=3078805 RepID=UPI0029435DC1|nr:flagellar basal body P-ring protein FlgI [Parvularcula sp. LCG005]WOI52934.1 flagellar basal body P-ring protein FlgI [Parvularcula sp. LCG005]
MSIASGLALMASPAWAQTQVRLKDLVDVEGVRGNDLIGYGLVIGLNGTGDTLRNSPYTEEALASLLERLGVNVQDEQFRPDNVAAVIVTGVLPPFARPGSRLDIQVSSIGDASSLQGGMLVMTPLLGADNEVYAVAQGPVVVSGFGAGGQAAGIQQGTPTLATVPGGARIERSVPFEFSDMSVIRLALRDPDFTTAQRIEQELNGRFLDAPARMLDSGTVELDARATGMAPASLMASIERMLLTPDQKARVVIDQRSGTIVLGQDVRIEPVAVAQGALTIKVTERPIAVPAAPFTNADTVVVPRTEIEVVQGGANIIGIGGGATLRDLVEGLNALNVAPRDMVEILEALKAAGALHAELILQ